MPNFNDPAATAAFTRFQSDFASHTQLIRYGQFYVTERLTDELLATIRTTLQSSPLAALVPGFVDNAMRRFGEAFRNGLPSASTLLAIVDSLGLPTELKALFAPTPSANQDAASAYTLVWSSPNIGAAPPWLGFTPTLDRIVAAHAYEKDKCFPVLRSLAAKLLRKRGVTALPSAARISDGALAGATLAGPAPTGASSVPQQTIRYTRPAALAGAYATMRAALDRGGLVQCGVLSGASHEHSAFPTPEHYVLAFGHGSLAGLPTFWCWDPDAAASQIAEATWGRGFTCLFALPDRLSTASDSADLAAIQTAKEPPASFGDHLTHHKRHAYQVYYVQTLPL